MSSTLVHLALGALLACALLGSAFGPRSLAVVLALTALPDLDTFLGLVVPGGHRALLHTLLVPTVLGALVAYDLRVRDGAWLRRHLGPQGPRVAVTALVALLVAGIGPDLFTNGVNALYPFHDQFYALSGDLVVSTERGVVQTFVQGSAGGTTATTHYTTGVDPSAGAEPADVERTFHVVGSGFRLLIVVAGTLTAGVRLWGERTPAGEREP